MLAKDAQAGPQWQSRRQPHTASKTALAAAQVSFWPATLRSLGTGADAAAIPGKAQALKVRTNFFKHFLS
jgi:hypothetical protein